MSKEICPYCSSEHAIVVVQRSTFNGRRVYECPICKARVGVHRNTWRSLGTVANAEDRRLRGLAHLRFDRLWKMKMEREKCSKGAARGAGYRWLAQQMQLSEEECHIAMLHSEDLLRIIQICTPPYGVKVA